MYFLRNILIILWFRIIILIRQHVQRPIPFIHQRLLLINLFLLQGLVQRRVFFNVRNGNKININKLNSRAIARLVTINCSNGEDENHNTPKASNRTIDLSKVDFGCELQLPPTDTPPENSKINEKKIKLKILLTLLQEKLKVQLCLFLSPKIKTF